MAEPQSVVVVESPAKAKTIGQFLGSGYIVEASIGHVRDLPRSAKDVPESDKKDKWKKLGVDVDHEFHPFYIVPEEKKPQITKLKGLLKEASELYLATDEDREGEALGRLPAMLKRIRRSVPTRVIFLEADDAVIQRRFSETRRPHPLGTGQSMAKSIRRERERLAPTTQALLAPPKPSAVRTCATGCLPAGPGGLAGNIARSSGATLGGSSRRWPSPGKLAPSSGSAG